MPKKVPAANAVVEEKSEEKKPERKPVKVMEFLRYNFTEPELKGLSKDLALAVQRQSRAQEEQKAAQAQFKQRIEAETATIGRLSNNINMGWDIRDIDCEVHYHTPVIGTKRIIRLDSGETVRDCAMSSYELQENLFEQSA